MFDLKITGGTIVDGTGTARFVGDVAIKDGVIAAVGPDLEGEASETLDASGHLVTPGFVDIHTHYDGQATWDSLLDPSASHGVTTIVTGNCGVGFAPVRPGDEKRLIEMMEGVEDIPGTALYEGIEWSWETFPQYLDALDGREYSMDIAAFVPHAPIRLYVMGERGERNEAATAEDIAEMSEHVRAAIAAGAVGVSTSRSLNHKTLDGELVAGTFAGQAELEGLASAMLEAGGGLFEVVPQGETGDDEALILGEIELISRVSKETGAEVSFLMVQAGGAPELWRKQLEAVAEANAGGAKLVPQVGGRPGGMLIGLPSYHGFMRRPTFRRLEAELSGDALVEALRDPANRAAILGETDEPLLPSEQFGAMTEAMPFLFQAMYPLGNPPNYEQTADRSIAGIAASTGRDPWEVHYDLLVDGEWVLGAFVNYAQASQEPLRAMIEDPATVLGLSDGGAHVKMICDASVPTYMLTHWVRDRERGDRLSLEATVQKQTSESARVVGMHDRGTIEVGKKADLNVIDFEGLTLHPPRSVNDLPAGGARILQDASGYRATIVSGVVTRRDDRDTGARPGRLVRSGRA
ncbi:MAG: amidohydrolase family protein [bacterium]|nr:amidohydrolase family protein [bacterium]